MSQAEVDRIVAVGTANAHLAHQGSFYSWGGSKHCGLTTGGRNETLFRQNYNQAVGHGSNGGPGLYVSTNLYDSASYCSATNGVLLQVDMPETMPYISALNHAIMNQLRNGNPSVTAQMLYRNNQDMPPILLNHSGTWHCLKTTKGVGFRLFDGRGCPVVDIQNAVDRLRNDQMHVAVNVLLSQLRADIRTQIH